MAVTRDGAVPGAQITVIRPYRVRRVHLFTLIFTSIDR